MRVAGIIAEYNPLHTGHVYHLNMARQITGAEYAVVVLSGDFVQRGEPAIVDKRRRTRMALAAGADVVLELPVSWATGSAERFAAGAVEILDRLGVVTDLVCGCECEDETLLEKAAHLLLEESESFRNVLKEALRSGLSFPQARAAALEQELPGGTGLLSGPNNILAIEYRKALLGRSSQIRFHGLVRSGAGYLQEELPAASSYASATALREAILAGRPPGSPELAAFLPPGSQDALDYCIGPDDLTLLLHHALHCLPAETILSIQDMAPELVRRLDGLRGELLTFRETAKLLKRCNIAHSRINRVLLHLVLGLTEPAPREIPAVRLLGFRKDTPLMRRLQDISDIPIITKLTDADPSWFASDIAASELYRSLVWQKTGIRLESEYRSHPVLF